MQKPGVADRRIRRLDGEGGDPGRERVFWRSPTAKNRHACRDPQTVHKLETPDYAPDGSGDPKVFTWLTAERFYRTPDVHRRDRTQAPDPAVPRHGGTGMSDPGNRCRPDRRRYLHAIIDDATRYWIAGTVTVHKDMDDVSPMFRSAKMRIGRIPAVLVSDKDRTYHDAWNRVQTEEPPAKGHDPRPPHTRAQRP